MNYKLEPKKPYDVFDRMTETEVFLEARCSACKTSWSWHKPSMSPDKIRQTRQRLANTGFTCEGCYAKNAAKRRDIKACADWGGQACPKEEE